MNNTDLVSKLEIVRNLVPDEFMPAITQAIDALSTGHEPPAECLHLETVDLEDSNARWCTECGAFHDGTLWIHSRRVAQPPASEPLAHLRRVYEHSQMSDAEIERRYGDSDEEQDTAATPASEPETDLYSLLVKRGYAQHEAHAIAFGDKLAVLSSSPPPPVGPFTVAKYGSLAAAITAERNWLRSEVARLSQPPVPAPVGLPALFTEIRHLLGRLAECFDENEEEHKDIGEMLSKLSAQPFCPKCGPTVMNCEWRCCKCGTDMKEGLPPAAYSTATKREKP